MAATNYQGRLSDYNKQLAEAKASFLERTGKKIAAGFKDTDDYKRILRNKRQYIYRYERKKAKNEVSRIKEKPESAISVRTLADREIFHLVLSYGDRVSRAIRDAFKLIKRQGAKTGQRAIVDITFPEPENNPETRIYENEVKVDMAFTRLYQMGLQKQKTMGSDALLITATEAKGKEGYYFIVIGEYA